MRFPNLETTSHTSEEKPGGWVELQYHRARGHGAWICPASATAPSRQWSRFSTRCHGVSNTQRQLQRRHLLQKSELQFIMIHYDSLFFRAALFSSLFVNISQIQNGPDLYRSQGRIEFAVHFWWVYPFCPAAASRHISKADAAEPQTMHDSIQNIFDAGFTLRSSLIQPCKQVWAISCSSLQLSQFGGSIYHIHI